MTGGDNFDDPFWHGLDDDLDPNSPIVMHSNVASPNKHVPHEKDRLNQILIDTRGSFRSLIRRALSSE